MANHPDPGPYEALRQPAPQTTRRRSGFGRVVGYTVAGTVLPGLGLLAAGRKAIGGTILALFLTAVAGLGVLLALDWQSVAAVVVRPEALRVLTWALVGLAGIWAVVIAGTHLSLRHQSLSRRPSAAQRIGGSMLVATLSFCMAAPLLVAARYADDQAHLVTKVFKSEKDTYSATRPTSIPTSGATAAAPWAGRSRVNILLLGGDAGKGRTGTRTDTVILASIDTVTGNTTMFSLPRNTAHMPFPKDSALHRYYPHGFTDNSGDGQDAEFFLNAMYDNVPRDTPKGVLGHTDNLGADVLKLSVGEALGLKVDYYALINLEGFTKMVDAIGGVTVNINTYIPIGGDTDAKIPPSDYLHPGKNQHLNGRSALWYARGRYGSDDYARMDRQRCVIDAVVKQANPANVLTRYERLAKAGGDIVTTDLPQEALPALVGLAIKVKSGDVRSIVFKNDVSGFVSDHPDFDRVRTRVKRALDESDAAPTPSSTSAPTPKRAPTKQMTPKAKRSASDEVSDACAYDPAAAASAVRPR